jgi:hypothetical protein
MPIDATVQLATPSSDATRRSSESVKAGGLRKLGSFDTATLGWFLEAQRSRRIDLPRCRLEMQPGAATPRRAWAA